MKDIIKILKNKVLVLDGATGTELQKRGMPRGAIPEVWCLDNPSVLSQVHKDYINSGSDVIYTCTFGANKIKLDGSGCINIKEVNRRLGTLAKKSAPNKVLVAGDIGPTGRFIEPFGPLKFEEAVKIFKEQVQGLLLAGVDLFVVETMMDIQEARAALIAIKELTNKFTIVTMTYEKDGRTLNGTDPLTALITLQSLGADAVGCNCSLGPSQMLDFIKEMKPCARVPLVAKPNAGMPKLIDGKTTFDMGVEKFASFAKKFISEGVGLIGGCCGTTPDHIRELNNKIYETKPVKPSVKSISALTSARRSLIIEAEKGVIVVGESINPTGKKKFQKELKNNKTSLIRQLAKDQEKSGAKLLDVNVGAAEIDEKKTLKNVISLLSVCSNLPLVIDSSKPEAIEQALRVYPGRALINSISGDKKNIKKLLPLAAKYGAMFILLPLDNKGIPLDFKKRKRVIESIFKQAQYFGFTKNDIVIDGLALAMSSAPSSALVTLKTISWCSKKFKCNSIIGLSNVSFGMPKRSLMNIAYLNVAKARGLSLVIANPCDKLFNVKEAKKINLKTNKDTISFVNYFSKIPSVVKRSWQKESSIEERISVAIIEGSRESIRYLIREALKLEVSADKLIKRIMVPAINKVGDLFDKKIYFLPQLIASAETMKLAFEVLKPYLKKDSHQSAKQTVILLATVKGDIHDIGKNIVGLMLQNHGFSVVDLGKDVSAARIIREIKRRKSVIVGLSALMTTTMVSIKEVISKARQEGLKCRFIIGGAVVTKAYASSLSAEYASDGVEAVRVAKRLNPSN